MTEPASFPSLAGVPPGTDFVATVFERIREEYAGQAPEALARLKLIVPTQRMQRRFKQLFIENGPCLLPRIYLVTDVGKMLNTGSAGTAISSIQRILDLKPLVDRLVKMDGRLADSSSIDLTESLAKLLDEMQGEGVAFNAVESLLPNDFSEHWEQNLRFLAAIQDYIIRLSSERFDPEALNRANVETLCAEWLANPPEDPVILAGSTGSRGTTRLLMNAVADLGSGCVVLPGLDRDLPEDIWEQIASDRIFEDHAQYRHATFLTSLCVSRDDIPFWGEPATNRNALVSLSLRPAPATDQWLAEGPGLGDLCELTEQMTLIEAASTKDEADAIALEIRRTLEVGESVAVIAPEATVARRVAVALDRWGIVPDDSGGIPGDLTTAGRFVRLVARLMLTPDDPVALVSLLKHPFTRQDADRGPHMMAVQSFEVFLRQTHVQAISASTLAQFSSPDENWKAWLSEAFELLGNDPDSTLQALYQNHMQIAACFACGEFLTSGEPGDDATQTVLTELSDASESDTPLSLGEYVSLLEKRLSAESARPQIGVHKDVMIWGTLEARVQGADKIILAGLNEGTWPEQPSPDPWLNRAMRKEIDLLLPERQIGLAAHDYQQAMGARSVVLTRALRADGSQTIPSRWLNRLVNLLDGLSETGGKAALNDMRLRGQRLLGAIVKLRDPDTTVQASPRPAPAPSATKRPRHYSITEIERLIRDPYAIYAKRILRLASLGPLRPEPGARLKGEVFHRLLEDFFHPAARFENFEEERQRLEQILYETLGSAVHNPSLRLEWHAQFSKNADWLIETEKARRTEGGVVAREVKGRLCLPQTEFVLSGKADRIDRNHLGDLVIYDYKTGSLPSKTQIMHFDRQLVLEALMAEFGSFDDVAPASVAHVAHIGVGRSPDQIVTELTDKNDTAVCLEDLKSLLTRMSRSDMGYLSRRAVKQERYEGDYDHLARFGEWDESQAPLVEPLK